MAEVEGAEGSTVALATSKPAPPRVAYHPNEAAAEVRDMAEAGAEQVVAKAEGEAETRDVSA